MSSAYVLLNVLCTVGKSMLNAYDKETLSDHYGYFYTENNSFSETKCLYSKANGTLSTRYNTKLSPASIDQISKVRKKIFKIAAVNKRTFFA